jgi:purine nucleoside phosphorylase
MSAAVALIVGSGAADLGLEVLARSPTKTPYGLPSSPVLTVRAGTSRVACLPRHGEEHGHLPHEINYRANLWALRERGARTCVAICTVGAISADFPPGELAVPEQLIDYTAGRAATYGEDVAGVRHVDFTEPFSPALREQLLAAIAECGFAARGGTYGVTQGPRLETAAEIDRMRRDGCTMVGMTAMPEAVLARELGLDYAVCAVAVNYAAGRSPSGGAVLDGVEQYTADGMRRAAEVLQRVLPRLEV